MLQKRPALSVLPYAHNVEKHSITQEQQRNLLGISHERYDHAWLHLQAMSLPRTDQFLADLERIVARVMNDQGIAIVHLKHLEDLILAGLQQT